MEPKAHTQRHCEVCGAPIFTELDTRCQNCLNAPRVKTPDSMPQRVPLMAKPDTRYSLPNPRQEYDGVPDPDLPVYVSNPRRLGFSAAARSSGSRNPSDPAYRTWTRAAVAWGIICAVVAALLLWRHHWLITAVLIAVTALILGFCSPNRYMQEEFLPEQFLTHRMSRALILFFAGGVPAYVIGWLVSLLLRRLF